MWCDFFVEYVGVLFVVFDILLLFEKGVVMVDVVVVVFVLVDVQCVCVFVCLGMIEVKFEVIFKFQVFDVEKCVWVDYVIDIGIMLVEI